MDLRQLRVFAEIVRQGSFTRAAERPHIAQPAVSNSNSIRKLANKLNLSLLNRQEKRVSLIAEGETLSRANRSFIDFLLENAVEE